MGKRLTLSMAGIVAMGVGLAGCQSSPSTTGVSSTTPARNATAQASQGWDKGSPTAQAGGMPTGQTGLVNGTTPANKPYNIDPNALPRTSQDALPRQVGNQTSSYNTVPNSFADSGSGGAAPPPPPSATSWQRATPGVTQTGLTLPAASGAPSMPTPPPNLNGLPAPPASPPGTSAPLSTTGPSDDFPPPPGVFGPGKEQSQPLPTIPTPH